MKLYGGSKNARRVEGRASTRKEAGESSAGARKKKKGLKRGLLISVCVVAVLVIGAFAAWNMLEPPEPERLPPDAVRASGSPYVSGGVTVYPSPSGGEEASEYREKVYTFLLVGTYEDGNTDTLMVGTLDRVNKTFNVMSVPRDTLVDVGRKVKKINAAYSVGGSGTDGMENLCREISTIVGFTPDFYVCVKMKGFKAFIDAMGGVEFNVPVDMYHHDGETVINLSKGQQKLNGDKALQLMRYRGYKPGNSAGIAGNDYGRMQVQQEFLKAVIKQLLQAKNIAKIDDFAKIASENIQPTNIESAVDFAAFAKVVAQEIGFDNITFQTLPTESISYKGDTKTAKAYYELIKKEEALEMINKTINPYTKDIALGDVSWMTLKN